jgi:hypothetical protein
MAFHVDDISVKRNLQGSSENPPANTPAQSTPDRSSRAESGSFDRIFEYTLFNETLQDGKHPVWIYYQSNDKIIRINMPSMDMCVVTPRSSPDMGVINSRNYDVIPKASRGWEFAMEIWKAAFQRWLIVGQPKPC